MYETAAKPVGLKIVRLATILVWATLGWLLLTVLVLSSFVPLSYWPLQTWVFIFLEFFLFAFIFLIGWRESTVWYMAIGFWVFFTVAYLYLGVNWGLTKGFWEGPVYFFYSLPLVYSLGSILYFQTRRVKEYFQLTKTREEQPVTLVTPPN